jgi:hypothetical protein
VFIHILVNLCQIHQNAKYHLDIQTHNVLLIQVMASQQKIKLVVSAMGHLTQVFLSLLVEVKELIKYNQNQN